MGALSMTGQPAKWEGFGPLVPGVSFARPNDIESLEAAVSPGGDLAAIILEPILGEGGIIPLEIELSPRRLRARPRARRAALRRRGADGSRPHGKLLRPCRGRDLARPRHARQGPRQRAADRGVAGAQRGCPGDRARAITPRPSAGTRSQQPRPVRSSRRSTTRSSRTCASRAPLSATGWPRSRRCVRCADAGSCSVRRSTGRLRRSSTRAASGACSCSRPGADVLRLTPPLVVEPGRGRRGARDARRGARDDRAAFASRRSCGSSATVRSRPRPSSSPHFEEEGHDVVQATVSRDIAELGLVKVRAPSGRLVYAAPGHRRRRPAQGDRSSDAPLRGRASRRPARSSS